MFSYWTDPIKEGHTTSKRVNEWMRVDQGFPPASGQASLSSSLCPPKLTWFARNGLNRQSQLGVRGDRQRLVAWGKGWDHDIRHVDLLKAKDLM